MLIVPSTAVSYDAEEEAKAEHEAKMAKIAIIEEAKQRDRLLDKGSGESNDGFIQKLLANIFKNLQVTITNVHVRYEDKQTNTSYPFGAGLTLDRLEISTKEEEADQKAEKSRSFRKLVRLESLAVYWQPRERNIYSDFRYSDDGVRDIQFKQKIARQNSTAKGLKYLLGPIHLAADMIWCPEPKKVNYTIPQVSPFKNFFSFHQIIIRDINVLARGYR